MAQIYDVTEETADLVAKISQETNLYNYANIEPLAISKQPVLIKVAKANAATEFKCQTTDLVFLYIYEDAFEKLTDEQKELMVREAMNQITVDIETGKIKIVQPQLNMTIGGYAKYGQKLIDCVVAAHTTVASLLKKEEKEKS